MLLEKYESQISNKFKVAMRSELENYNQNKFFKKLFDDNLKIEKI